MFVLFEFVVKHLLKKKKTNKPRLPALKNVPMLGETNNQFYMA
jgi:hypothetical protein